MHDMLKGPYYNHQGYEIDTATFDAVRLLKRKAHEIYTKAESELATYPGDDMQYWAVTRLHSACFHLLGLHE